MKNIMITKILITILSLFSLNTFSQYQSYFGETQTSWEYIDYSSLSLVFQYKTHVFGDTIINDSVWNIVKYDYENPAFSYYLYEDTTKGLLLHKSNQLTNNLLLCDLTLQVGDSIRLPCDVIWGDYFITVDSVYTDNFGRKIIRFDFLVAWEGTGVNGSSFTDKKFKMIEGVGLNNTMDKICERTTYLLCQTKDNELTHINEIFNTCDVITGNERNLPPQTNIKIYPNPAKDNIFIENIENSNLSIYDLSGKVIQKLNNIKTNQLNINIDFLQKGLYIIVIKKNNNIYRKKLIVIK